MMVSLKYCCNHTKQMAPASKQMQTVSPFKQSELGQHCLLGQICRKTQEKLRGKNNGTFLFIRTWLILQTYGPTSYCIPLQISPEEIFKPVKDEGIK